MVTEIAAQLPDLREPVNSPPKVERPVEEPLAPAPVEVSEPPAWGPRCEPAALDGLRRNVKATPSRNAIV